MGLLEDLFGRHDKKRPQPRQAPPRPAPQQNWLSGLANAANGFADFAGKADQAALDLTTGAVKGIGNSIGRTGAALGDIGFDAYYGLTGNKTMQQAARQQFKSDFDQSIPGAVYKPLDVLGTALGTSLGAQSLYRKGYDPITVTNAANEQYDKVGLNLFNAPGVSQRKIAGAGAETALNLATAGQPIFGQAKASLGAQTGKVLAGDALKKYMAEQAAARGMSLYDEAFRSGQVNGATGALSGAASTLQQDDIKATDFLKNAGVGYVGGTVAGTATPYVYAGATKGMTAAANGIRSIPGRTKGQLIDMASAETPVVNARPDFIQGSGKQLDPSRVKFYEKEILNGRQKPIVVVKDGDGVLHILDGDHRLAAYNNLGADFIPTKQVSPSQMDQMMAIYRQANDFTSRHLVPGGTLGAPLGKGFDSASKRGRVFDGVDGIKRYEMDDSNARLVARGDAAKPSKTIRKAEDDFIAGKITPDQLEKIRQADARQATIKTKKQLPQTGNKVTTVSIPEDAPSSGMRQRGLASTILDDPNTAPQVKAGISEMYKVRDTKDLQSRAANLVKDDPDLALRVFNSDSISDVGTMIGSELAAHLSRNGQHEAAIEVAQKLARDATHRGQANQALSTWGKLAPESVLRFAQKTVNEYNKTSGLAGTANELKLTTRQAENLAKKSEDLQKMPAGREKDIATKQMMNDIKELVPASWVQKLSTAQTIAQLLNPKTLIRNIGGNTMFAGVENISQAGAAGLDALTSKITGNPRTTALPSFKAQFGGLKKGGREAYQEATRGVNLGPDTQYDLNSVPTFRKGPVAAAEKSMGIALRVPDRAAFQAAYDDTIHGLLKANKLDAPTPEIEALATANGLYRTFQDNSKAAQLFTGLKGALNHVGVEGKDGARFGLGDLLLKYPKTPGNILSRGIDYSPVGVIKGIAEIAKPAMTGRPFDQHAFVNATSRGVVGTGAIMGAGTVLGALGIITEKPSDDTDTRNLQKQSGLGGYQINISALRRFLTSGLSHDAAQLRPDDTLVSYDWAQPLSIPLSAGAAIGKGQSAKDGAISTIQNATEGFNTLVEQPLVTGINTFASNIKNKGIVGAVGETVKGAPASFIPTASNQVRQLTDNTTRNTYAPNGFQQAFNMALNRIPIADRALFPQVDSLGNDKQNYQNGSNNIFNVAMNPAFVTKYQPSKAGQLPLDILNRSGETQQMPRQLQTTQKINGSNIKLTPKQNYDLQKYVGTATKDMLTTLQANPGFMAQSDQDKAKTISGRLSDITNAGKIAILGNQPKTVSATTKSILNGTPTYKTTVASSIPNIAPSLPKNLTDAITTYGAMSADERKEAFTKEKDAEFKYEAAKYENDKALGKVSDIQKISREKKLAKLQIGASYDKPARELYEMSKSDIYDYITTHDNGDKLAEQLQAYDRQLYDAGITSSLKFKTGLAPAKGGKKGTGKGKKLSLPGGPIAAGTVRAASAAGKAAAGAKIAKASLPQIKKISGRSIKQYKKSSSKTPVVRRKSLA